MSRKKPGEHRVFPARQCPFLLLATCGVTLFAAGCRPQASSNPATAKERDSFKGRSLTNAEQQELEAAKAKAKLAAQKAGASGAPPPGTGVPADAAGGTRP